MARTKFRFSTFGPSYRPCRSSEVTVRSKFKPSPFTPRPNKKMKKISCLSKIGLRHCQQSLLCWYYFGYRYSTFSTIARTKIGSSHHLFVIVIFLSNMYEYLKRKKRVAIKLTFRCACLAFLFWNHEKNKVWFMLFNNTDKLQSMVCPLSANH